ncbi:centromere protein M-like [Ostrea edulis]|uniref:centromere protein M-like n=1 Tax=Ostrea edulis TaxID=37623 RepID=UPI0024AF7034|nr:centromere protein M-like [Ostrea edulis]
MSDSILTPYNKMPQHQLATVLLVGSEGIGKHDFGKCLIKNSWFYLQVRTTITLPLPMTSDNSRPRIDYICFLIDLTSRDSFQTVEESLKHIDVRYFQGKCCFVALKVKNPEKRAIFLEQIIQLSKQCKSDVLYGSLETEAESVFLSEQILKSAEIAAGLQKNVSPMFLECTQSFRTEEGEWTENGNSC